MSLNETSHYDDESSTLIEAINGGMQAMMMVTLTSRLHALKALDAHQVTELCTLWNRQLAGGGAPAIITA